MLPSFLKTIHIFLLLASAFATVGQDRNKKPRELDDYVPRTLKELSQREANKPETINENLVIQGDIVPSRVRIAYEVSSKPLTQNKKELIRHWANRYAGATEFYTRPYETEVLFSEGEQKYWLVVRKEFLPMFEKELKKGDVVDLFLIKLGSVKNDDTWEPVLLAEKVLKP
jgi:hypothetical protein